MVGLAAVISGWPTAASLTAVRLAHHGAVDVRIAICPASHLLRVVWPSQAGEFATARCPQCASEVRVRRVDGRMLSQESLTEAWRHRGG